jgi:hypothetical protein
MARTTAFANNEYMNLRVIFVVLLCLICAQATLTASTSYSFGTPPSPISLGKESYLAGVWTEDFTGGNPGTTQQIDCVVGLTIIAQICGAPGPGTSVNINIPIAPGNQGILPAGTTNYLVVDGDDRYGAPVSTPMTGLTVGATYQVTFYQASSEETGNNQADNDNWDVYVIPGTTGAEYICPTCATPVDPGGILPTFTSAVINNPGGPTSTNWEEQQFTFKATQTNEILEFVTYAVTAVAGGTVEPPFFALTGVATDLVAPEPGTWVLTLLGAGLVFAGSRLRKRRSKRG